jgi:methylthioribose-1-phosphate isomerase
VDERGLRFEDGSLLLLDQTALPAEERWLRLTSAAEVAEAIRRLAVRGAPAIGLAAAYGLVVEALNGGGQLGARIDAAAELLAATRPTAVNLRWALDRALEAFARALPDGERAAIDALVGHANDLAARQLDQDRRIGEHGAHLLEPGARVLTHCNSGPLATGGAGTGGSVLATAWRDGRLAQVWVDETRPLLQGARLTAWELGRAGIPYQLVPDSAGGALMARGLVDAVVVGADRIAANGDVANKIGTYAVAAIAQRHGIPFYVAAPLSTIDSGTATGDAIPIEERSPDEVTSVQGTRVAPEGALARNLAFDVTPHELVAAIVTEAGVLRAPFAEAIAGVLGSQPALKRPLARRAGERGERGELYVAGRGAEP